MAGSNPRAMRHAAASCRARAALRTIGGTLGHALPGTGADVTIRSARPAIQRFALPGTTSMFTRVSVARSRLAAMAAGAATNPPIATTSTRTPPARHSRIDARTARTDGPQDRRNL